MIIQCEKCSTKFRLDDSRVTTSGVRVRCSRCSHTFVVRREPAEDAADFDAMLDGLLGDADRPGDARDGEDDGQGPAAGEAGSDRLPVDRNDRDEPEEREAAPADDAARSRESFRGFFRRNAGLPQFQTPAAVEQTSHNPVEDGPNNDAALDSPVAPEAAADGAGEASVDVCETKDAADFAPDADGFEQASVERSEDWLGSGLDRNYPEEGNTDSGQPASAEPDQEPSPGTSSADMASVRRELWPVADDKFAEDEELPPLSIASRRRGSPMKPVLLGIGLLVVLAGALLYLVSDRLSGLVPDSLVQSVGNGRKPAGDAVLRSLEGHFLVNRQAGELFVMRGEVVNVSDRPLTSLRVRGTLYGAGDEVVAQRTVYCGNDLAPADLAFNSYTSIERSMGRMFGVDLANLEVQPGKAIPFLIVFKGVSSQATQFEASLVPFDAGQVVR